MTRCDDDAQPSLDATAGDDMGGSAPLGPEMDADPLEDRLRHRELRSRLFGSAPSVTVGGYEISHRIGAGGMGVVFAARDHRLQRHVALKLVLAGDARAHVRMLGEARALARLAHPNVVTVHEVGEHDGRVFVAMELVAGETLRVWLGRRRSLAEIAAVFVQAAEGLAAAHRAGLVHRDFKPDNVIIGTDDNPSARALAGRVRVVDFGLAFDGSTKAAMTTTTVSLADPDTRPRELGGTPRYMALEQFGDRTVDARADVFAFCVTLYEALHGERPFPGDTIGDLVFALEQGPRGLRWRRDVPRALVRLVEAGLATDPAHRPATLDPLIAALRSIGAPSRKRAWLLGAGLVLGGAGVGVWSQIERTPAAPAVTAAPVPEGSNRAIDNVCAPESEPDARSCDGLFDALATNEAAVHDWETRCAYRRACAPTQVVCPAGTQWDGTLGCALAVCTAASDTDAAARCEGGDASCCTRSAWARYGAGVSTPQERSAIIDELSRACAAGDAWACTGLASASRDVDDDDDDPGAVAALATSCRLGFMQACRRIAVLPEDLEGVRTACTSAPDDECPPIPTGPQLTDLARCRTLVYEHPEPDRDLVREAVAAGVELGADERTALAEAQAAVDSADAAAYLAMWREIAGDAEAPSEDLDAAILGAALERYGDVENARAIQRLADARAGLSTATPARGGTVLDRWYQQQVTHADRLEREIAARLGDARAAEIHAQRELWPGYGVSRFQGRCPD